MAERFRPAEMPARRLAIQHTAHPRPIGIDRCVLNCVSVQCADDNRRRSTTELSQIEQYGGRLKKSVLELLLSFK